MTQILMQNMTVRSWLVMTNNFEHKGKTTFKSRKLTDEWARIQRPSFASLLRGDENEMCMKA